MENIEKDARQIQPRALPMATMRRHKLQRSASRGTDNEVLGIKEPVEKKNRRKKNVF